MRVRREREKEEQSSQRIVLDVVHRVWCRKIMLGAGRMPFNEAVVCG